MKKEFEIKPGIILSKLDINKDDVILMTVDLDVFDIDTTNQMLKIMVSTFPDNKVVATFKGIEINKLREKSKWEID